MQKWKEYIDNHQNRFLEELRSLLVIPSVSTDGKSKTDMVRCADLLKEMLLKAGCDMAEVHPTAHHPVVFAKKIANEKWPTVLVYGHYDVQPADPIGLWESDPFDAQIKDGKIIARGASDDKGQMFIHLKALEMLVRTNLLPCNIKFIIEGEEEIGSPSLPAYLKEHKEDLSADVVLASDTAMISVEHPSIETSLRGMAYMEVEVTGPNRDLHSGVFGGAVANPITILCQMLASLHDEDNHITIPGFYDKVRVFSEDERTAVARIPFNEQQYKQELGVRQLWGEKGYSTLERTGIRPTLEINGIWGGYTGEGAKTVLPSKAHAKVSMRLIAGQRPEEIAALFKEYFIGIAPESVSVDIKLLNTGEPVIADTCTRGFKAAERAIEKVFGKIPFRVYSGGSIPIVALFKNILQLDTVLLGFGLDNDNIHSPNEKLDITNFLKGIETVACFHHFFS